MQYLTCAYATTFHLTVLLLHPHVQRRQHQRPLSLISIPRRNINQIWQYGNSLDIEKTNAYLSLRIDTVRKNCGHKAPAKTGNTSNMFTYISEHHPSMKI